MRVVVASLNPVKLGAVQRAFGQRYPGLGVEVRGLQVDSGVAAQPMSDAETLEGARNRVANARRAYPEADFHVGLEGGLQVFDGQLLAFAWMAVGGPDGRISEARSATLPLPPKVHELIANGMELGEANDRVFETVNSKQAGGAFGLLTDGYMTRESVYADTLVLALLPFSSDLWP
ncbi:MAG: non-canonical purine NTP phosphatase [Xanthomonadales bacterium]|nr:non-canonical purine NTP phosphatase [Xanthomonadales bacterium]NIN59553.1 non-canonical purine NTP phosphatase [Xanthomonadales bacterium]NIN74919.1 non-canonical purine NTP phosphatase [Xanthomonadales bacterium]NIO14061.1 non-canonical purine NTP phosphatase [Xanthomonadales bacterium]NIP11946.1 non-canonical purine NTP phosphatase [Xanthomonadales bacterium]